ncbi:ABC transporter substrate-binding protein [Streptomyces sp. NPDC001508]|uniref:ABC transporter substrate-binding protein n=1 Tax=Streptomyces sp. NPDC001508 TaxID=3154656 RepID=UPI00332C8305
MARTRSLRVQPPVPERIWGSADGDCEQWIPAGTPTRYPLLPKLLAGVRRAGGLQVTGIVVLGSTWYRANATTGSGSRLAELTLGRISPPYGLTHSELDVLTLLACGATNATIAERFNVTVRTVSTHVEHILAKLDLTNRTGAASLALRHGLLRLPLPGIAPNGEVLTEVESALALVADDEQRAGRLRRHSVQVADGAGRGRSGSPIRLGSVFPLATAEGKDMLHGATLAVEAVNAAGGIGGRWLEHVVESGDTGRPESLADALAALERHGIDAVTFPYVERREAVPLILDAAADLEIPFLHTMTSASAEEQVRTDMRRLGRVFQLSPGDRHYGTEFIRFLHSARGAVFGGRERLRAVVLTDDHHIPSFLDEWREYGRTANVEIRLRSCSTETQWREAPARLADERPDAVLVASFLAPSVRTFLDAFYAAPSPVLLYCLWVPGTTAFAGTLGHDEGIIWATTTGRYTDQLGSRFQSQFLCRFGTEQPTTSASIHYDAVQLLRRAWSDAGTTSPVRVSAALRDLVHRGVNGSYFMGGRTQAPMAFPAQSRDLSLSQAHLILQVQDQENRIIAPLPFAVTRLRPQPWMRRPVRHLAC